MTTNPSTRTGQTEFILFDGRARVTGDTDDAIVMVVADSLEEARSYKGSYGEDSIWFEYKFVSDDHAEEVGPRYDIET